jgi:hypothetical protein
MSIDNMHMIEVLAVNVQSGTSKKTGNGYTLYKAQCVIHGPNQSLQIGELFLKEEIAKGVVPGKYLADCELYVNFDREVALRVVAMQPWGVAGAKPAATGSTPVAAVSTDKKAA